MNKQLAVIGLDGMPWHILQVLFAKEAMPTLKSLAQSSFTGILKSTIPPMTPSAWTSIASGVNPGKHGVFGFSKFDENFNTTLVTSKDVHYPRVHEIVAFMGMKSVCVNLPFTFPIFKITGTSIISDWLGPRLACHPRSIKKYMKDYHTYTPISKFKDKNDFLSSEYYEASKRVKTINNMLKDLKWNLFFVVFNEPDHLFHKCYQEVLEGNKKTLQIFEKIDETIKTALEKANCVMVLSDHGFSKYEYALNVNSYLSKYGLIRTTKKKTMMEFTDYRADKGIKNVHFSPKLYKILKSSTLKPLKNLGKKTFNLLSGKKIRAILPYVDPQKSKAFMPFSDTFGIYVKKEIDVNSVIDKLKENKGIDQVFTREQLYQGPYTHKAPDILFTPRFNEGWIIGTAQVSPITVSKGEFFGHHPDGIIIIHKRNQDTSKHIGEIDATDIVPTILTILNLHIPINTDGKVIRSIVMNQKKLKKYNYLQKWLINKKITSLRDSLNPKKREK